MRVFGRFLPVTYGSWRKYPRLLSVPLSSLDPRVVTPQSSATGRSCSWELIVPHHSRSHLLSGSSSTLRSWSTALDTTCLWSLQVVCRNPLFVVGLSSTCNSWAVPTNDWYSVRGIDFFATARGTLGALTTLALSGEVGDDPNAVEEINDSHEKGRKEEIEEDAGRLLA